MLALPHVVSLGSLPYHKFSSCLHLLFFLLCLWLVRCWILACPSVGTAGGDAALVVLMAGRTVGISFPGLHVRCLCLSGWQLGPWCIALHSGLWNDALWWLRSQKSHQADQQWRISWANTDLRYKKRVRAEYWADRSSEWRVCQAPSSMFWCHIRMTSKKNPSFPDWLHLLSIPIWVQHLPKAFLKWKFYSTYILLPWGSCNRLF